MLMMNSVIRRFTFGNVVVSDGIKYEIESSGTVKLAGGFNVEKGGILPSVPHLSKCNR